MVTRETRLEEILVGEAELWHDGPPHALFEWLRSECPVHWTPPITECPGKDGFWSVTRADDVHAASGDWQTYSSERGGITALTNAVLPRGLVQAMFIGIDPPPKRIAEHEGAIPGDHGPGARPPRGTSSRASPSPWSPGSSAPSWGSPPRMMRLWARLINTIIGAGDPDLNQRAHRS